MLKKIMCSMLACMLMLLTACGSGSTTPPSVVTTSTTESTTDAGSANQQTGDTSSSTTVSGTQSTDGDTGKTTAIDATAKTTAAKTAAKTTAKAPAKTTVKTTAKADTLKTLINSAKLSPMKTNFPTLDNMIDGIFADIHTSGMSTYDKVKACYKYLVDNFTYGGAFPIMEDIPYASEYDKYLVEYAYSILSNKVGACDDYSAAFVVMCRRLGLEAYTMSGTVSKKGGGRTAHTWAYVVLGGAEYIFDPQVQANNPEAPDFFFGKTYSQMGTRYEKESGLSTASKFKSFKINYVLSLSTDHMNLESGSYLLVLTGIPSFVTIEWESSNPAVATAKSYYQHGEVTGHAAGTATITAKVTVDGKTQTDSLTVTVK